VRKILLSGIVLLGFLTIQPDVARSESTGSSSITIGANTGRSGMAANAATAWQSTIKAGPATVTHAYTRVDGVATGTTSISGTATANTATGRARTTSTGSDLNKTVTGSVGGWSSR